MAFPPSAEVSSGPGSSRPSLSPRLTAFVTHIHHPTSAAAASSVIVSTLRFFSCRLHEHHPSHSEELSSSSPPHKYREDKRRNYFSMLLYSSLFYIFSYCRLSLFFTFELLLSPLGVQVLTILIT